MSSMVFLSPRLLFVLILSRTEAVSLSPEQAEAIAGTWVPAKSINDQEVFPFSVLEITGDSVTVQGHDGNKDTYTLTGNPEWTDSDFAFEIKGRTFNFNCDSTVPPCTSMYFWEEFEGNIEQLEPTWTRQKEPDVPGDCPSGTCPDGDEEVTESTGPTALWRQYVAGKEIEGRMMNCTIEENLLVIDYGTGGEPLPFDFTYKDEEDVGQGFEYFDGEEDVTVKVRKGGKVLVFSFAETVEWNYVEEIKFEQIEFKRDENLGFSIDVWDPKKDTVYALAKGGQAVTKGVKTGWKIREIDGKEYLEGASGHNYKTYDDLLNLRNVSQRVGKVTITFDPTLGIVGKDSLDEFLKCRDGLEPLENCTGKYKKKARETSHCGQLDDFTKIGQRLGTKDTDGILDRLKKYAKEFIKDDTQKQKFDDKVMELLKDEPMDDFYFGAHDACSLILDCKSASDRCEPKKQS